MDWGSVQPYVLIVVTVALTLGSSVGTLWLDRRWRHAREDELATLQRREWNRQQWWTRRRDVYAELMGDLWALRQSLMDELTFYETRDRSPRQFPHTRIELLDRIERIASVDRMTLSPETVEVVDRIHTSWAFVEVINHRDDAYTIASERLDIVNAALTELRSLAFVDLEIDGPPALSPEDETAAPE